LGVRPAHRLSGRPFQKAAYHNSFSLLGKGDGTSLKTAELFNIDHPYDTFVTIRDRGIYMLRKGQDSLRELIWAQQPTAVGWGCSGCTWMFMPSGPPIGKSLDEMKMNFEQQRSEEFARHACAQHPRVREATPLQT
jgi:hypothetical protein